MFRTVVLVCMSLALLGSVSAHGALLNLTQQPPDITVALVQVDFTAGTGDFTAVGLPLALDLDGIAPPDYNILAGLFSLSVNLDPLGVPTGGDVIIGGTIPGVGAISGVLATATLTDFGFVDAPGGEIFEFLFAATGGDMVDVGLVVPGAPLGVILDAGDTGFDGTFTQDFSNGGLGVADAFIIPEPLTIVLLIGGFGLLARRKG